MSDSFVQVDAPRPHEAAEWIVTCDHASNLVPPCVNNGDLGIDAADMQRHIAYDIGAEGVSRALGQCLNAPALCSRFSRLVIDPNRGEDDPTLVMRLYDGTIIPANRISDARERNRRLTAFHRPYHKALEKLCAQNTKAVLLAVHSFTPQLKGRPPRPWHIGVLYAGHNPLAQALIASLQKDPELIVGDNEPYNGHLPGDAMDRHAVQTGRPHVLIEIRNDLIETQAQQTAWAHRLIPHLSKAREAT